MTSTISLQETGKIANGSKIKGGCVKLMPKEKMHRHSTENGEEIIIVLEGSAKIIIGELERMVRVQEAIFIPTQTQHEVINETESPLRYVYVVGGK
ncbi:MAG: cupin domain-containing protein [Candidatus Bilamarchaeum sp.]|jgi:quercetin dioxygenase-like cupin family protein